MAATFSHTLWYAAGTILTMDDFRAVRAALYRGRNKWIPIGYELELKESDLITIEFDCRDNDECLNQMIHLWLASDRRPTWESLIAALKEPTVGDERVAHEIEVKYVKQTSGMWGVKYVIPLPQAIDTRTVFCCFLYVST